MDNYEKKYNEALERARQIHSEHKAQCFDVMVKVFPELAESEDEKVRKSLINYFDRFKRTDEFEENIEFGKVVAWLEKQGEQKYIPKYKIGDYVKNTNYKGEPIYEIVYMDKECYICEYRGKKRMGDKAVMHFSFDNPYLRLVQKPAIKLELDDNGEPVLTPFEAELFSMMSEVWQCYSFGEEVNIAKFVKEHSIELLERANEQKTAWSEEDKKEMTKLISWLNGCIYHSTTQEEVGYKRFVANWLKSLRPQKQWKPSDEQMKALKWCSSYGASYNDVLKELYEQLKKLREE